MNGKATRSAVMAALKVASLAVFVYVTNAGIVDRITLLVDQERYRGLVLYVGLWGFCIGCLLIVAFHPGLRWRVFWATVIAATTFAGYAFMRATDSQLNVFHIVTMWTAFADAGRATSFYARHLVEAFVVALFGFVALTAPPPRLRPLMARGVRLLSISPAIPIVALSAMITVRIGDDTVAMPQQFVPAAIGAVAGVKLMTHEVPAKRNLTAEPADEPAARHLVLIVDESVTAEFVSLRDGAPVTPFLARNRDRFVDFGVAAAASNCSANSNAVIRFGGSQADLRGTMRSSPYLWEYARRAGFRTVFIDAASSHIKNPVLLQNYMTVHEKAMIDEYITISDRPDPELDLALSARIAEILQRPEPHLIYANKNGAHFPYDNSYPADRALFHPTESEAAGEPGDLHRRNSFRNAVHWSVDVFFADLLARAEFRDTVVIYTSDHGQNIRVGKSTHCTVRDPHPDEGRVPLLVLTEIAGVRRRFEQGVRLNADRTSHFAIFPTVLDLLGYRRDRLRHRYDANLFEQAVHPQRFTSGDIMGIFGEEFRWNPIDRPAPES